LKEGISEMRIFERGEVVIADLMRILDSGSIRNMRVVERGYLTVGVSEMCELLKENT
jgi:hypothetical protein